MSKHASHAGYDGRSVKDRRNPCASTAGNPWQNRYEQQRTSLRMKMCSSFLKERLSGPTDRTIWYYAYFRPTACDALRERHIVPREYPAGKLS